MALNNNQLEAFEATIKGGIHFITGGAGVGKSYTIEEIIKAFIGEGKKVIVTAPTGLSALNVKGKTIHSVFGLPFCNTLTTKKIKSSIKYKKDISLMDVLIIDEISMVSRYQLDMIDTLLQYGQGFDKPFGGVTVVMVGDFMQLPPIIKEWEDNSHVGKPYAFFSEAWKDSNVQTHYLAEKVRQDQSDPLAKALDYIRDGKPTEAYQVLSTRIGTPPTDRRITNLYVKNVNVEAENRRALGELKTPLVSLKSKHNLDEEALRRFLKSSIVEETLELKVGCEVIFIRNDKGGAWVNGTRGVVEDIGEVSIRVRTKEDMHFVEKEEFIVSIDEEEKSEDSFKQFPLKLAYALTIHKSQGMTIDSELHIDLSGSFVEGLGYVALSRATKLENLFISGLNERLALKINPIALRVENKIKK